MKLGIVGWGLSGAFAAVLLATLGWGLGHAASRQPATRVGWAAPALTLHTLDGRQVALSDFRGTSLVVNFWASWREPCRQEAPVLNAAALK